MSTEPIHSQIGFWKTVGLLLRAARRRSAGRMSRQQQLLNNRTGSSTDTFNALSMIAIWGLMALLNGGAAYIVHDVISTTQRIVLEQNAEISNLVDHKLAQPGVTGLTQFGPLPALLASVVLLGWFVMLVFQGEGLELDLQRRRHPMWEWLFSHPVKPAAVFLAEMLSPIAANPSYTTAPLFFGVLYGRAYDAEVGVAAAFLIGVPVAVAAACLGKALEIGIMLRFPPRSRGGLLGLMSWFGQASMFGFLIAIYAMEPIIAAVAGPLRPVAALFPWPLLSWTIGLRPDGSLSFVAGMLFCWFTSAVLIGGGIWFAVWGAQRGLAGHSAAASSPSAKPFLRLRLFQRDPLYKKEILWFLRDRSALVQAILIPVTIASFQLFNFRGLIGRVGQTWQLFSGIAVIFGAYFLYILGPRSLASEGPALWLAQTWPRGLEELMKAKARLWFVIATALVTLVLAVPVVLFPFEAWKVLLIWIGWLAFGRSMSAKAVTLVSAPSSSGEPEPIPKGRRWAASLGMLTFAIGILSQRWSLAIVGIVYSWVTAAAMWENFRARLPYLFDPWSEKLPPPPTLMHAMIAISAFIEGAAVVSAIALAIFTAVFGTQAASIIQSAVYGLCAVVTWAIVSEILANRGLSGKEVWRWRSQTASVHMRPWWSGDGTWGKRFFVSLAIGAAAGVLLAFLAKGYVLLMSQFDVFAPTIRSIEEQMNSVPELRIGTFIIAVIFAPFAEEYLFRGLLFRALDRQWGGWPAMLGSAAFFAVYHQPFGWPPVALVGLANAFIFKKTGRLAPAVILHMVYNAIVLY